MAQVNHWQDQLPPPLERCDFSAPWGPRFCAALAPMIDDQARKGFGWRTEWLATGAGGAIIPSGKGSPGDGPFAGLFYRARWGEQGRQVKCCPFCATPIVPPARRGEAHAA